ncbi:MAG: glutamine synthetase family protein [Bacteroidota bacterium]
MNQQSILTRLDELQARQVKFAVADIDGVLRGKIIDRQKFEKGLQSKFGFCNVIFGWDLHDQCYDNSKISGWHTGYGDAMASIDLSSFRQIPWQDQQAFFLADFEHANESIAAVCPRSLLKRVRQQCTAMGFRAYFANEFEWFNFKETPQSLAEKKSIHPHPITPGMFGYSLTRLSQQHTYVDSIFNQLKQFGIPLEGFHTETGPGVYEAAIRYTTVLEAADRAILFKQGVREIAAQHGIMASFMAKWHAGLPGCSGHLHQSLWDAEGKQNLFGHSGHRYGMSELMEQYVAGQLYCLPHIMPLFAPTINSYKRYVSGSWAAVSASWGIENRTTALRIINHETSSTRVETRVPGADANPYLSMAAALAAGLYGIRHQLKLTTPPTTGNEYENTGRIPLPTNLQKATQTMKSSAIAKELLGEVFVDHFVRTREWEWLQFEQSVTDWELNRYFELV